MTDDVVTIRRFNRGYTQRIGALHDRFLGLDRPLASARLLFEIGPGGAVIADLRARLGLDAGYLSRLLRSLESDGLVETVPDTDDRRRRRARLTDSGQHEWMLLDQRSDRLAADLLSPLSDSQRARLADALDTADRLLRAATVTFATVDPSGGEAIAAMTNYFDELDERFDGGFDPGDTLIADAGHMRPPQGAFVVVRSDGDTIACGGALPLGDGVGEIKRMWVDAPWRGLGIGRRLLRELEDHHLRLGHHTVRLDTNSALTEAIAMYESGGYRPIEQYNDNPFAWHWFEKSLAGA